MDVISPAVLARIRNRGISKGDWEYCIEHPTDTYQHRGDTVYVGMLQDGRHIKVSVRPGSERSIANAFCFQ